VIALPPASTTVTAGEPGITPPDVPPDDGCVDTFSADAVPIDIVTLLLVALGYPVAVNVSVYEPVGPLIARLLNVATPLAFVTAVSVPARTGVFCVPEGDGEVPSAAVTVTPAAATPPDCNVTAGCVASATPTCPFDGCCETELVTEVYVSDTLAVVVL
jgi:hypothetical protein